MSEYDMVKRKKLVLKGEKPKSKKRKHKSSTKHETIVEDVDSIKHGNWWKVCKVEEITGPVAIEVRPHTYVKALDNGLFTLGATHEDGEGPSPEEILTAIVISENKIALKSGYNKYLKVEKNGIVTGRSDAIGPMEQWEPIFQDGKLALFSANNTFLSADEDDDTVVAVSTKATEEQIINIRSQTTKNVDTSKDIPPEEQSLTQMELNYVKRFQKFQDKKIKVCSEPSKELKHAKEEGNLYEKMLDRRSKMKADRYCK